MFYVVFCLLVGLSVLHRFLLSEVRWLCVTVKKAPIGIRFTLSLSLVYGRGVPGISCGQSHCLLIPSLVTGMAFAGFWWPDLQICLLLARSSEKYGNQTRTEMDLEVMSGTWKAVKPSSMEGAMRIHCMSLHSPGRMVGGGKWSSTTHGACGFVGGSR